MADEPRTYTQDEVDQMVAGLKSNRDELAKEAKAAKERLRAYEGVDPEEHKRLKAASEEAERKRAAAEGDFKSLEKQMAERHQQELSARDARTSKLTKALEQHLIEGQLATHLAEAGAKPEFQRLLKLEGQRYLKLQEAEDGFSSQVIDPATGTPMVADGSGSRMTVADLVSKTLKTQYPDAFQGSGSSGGGAPKSTAGSGGGAKVIAKGDNAGFIANLADVAKGTVEVRSA